METKMSVTNSRSDYRHPDKGTVRKVVFSKTFLFITTYF